jgi:transcriptional regulator with XRE-family HTH domain
MASPDLARGLAANLAANLRHQRQRRRLTQARMAALCGLPRSTIAQLESGAGNPTVSVLSRLASALRLTIEEMLSTPHARCQVFPRGTLPVAQRGRDGAVVVRKLLPDPIPGMEIDRIELRPGARMTGVPHRPGTREYLACERGTLTLRTAGESHRLGAGDLLAFDGDQPHSYHNDGASAAVGYSVVTLSPLPPGPPGKER